jgi:SLOG cluster3 family
MIAPVFLSASEPDPKRRPEYTITANVVNLRLALRAFCAHVLPNFPLVFGGHPAITPFVRTAADRIAHDLAEDPELAAEARLKAPQVVLFQSRLFFDREAAPDELLTPPLDQDGKERRARNGWRNESLLLMRYEMLGVPVAPGSVDEAVQAYAERFGRKREARLGTREFSAAVFIGGMEGVQREFHIFRSFHPDTPTFPIVSTGAACKALLGEVQGLFPQPVVASLEHETAYSLLMQQILPLGESLDVMVGWRRVPVPFRGDQHGDPKDINVQFIEGVAQKRTT